MPDTNIEILRKKTYLKAIENSVGSKIFNSIFVKFKDTNKTKDILNDGEYSCAFFVSSILYLSKAIDEPYVTVKNLRDFFEKDQNWKKIEMDRVEAGDVVFWEKMKFEDNSENEHVGFVLNKNTAVSTSHKDKMVVQHTLSNNRNIESVYRYLGFTE